MGSGTAIDGIKQVISGTVSGGISRWDLVLRLMVLNRWDLVL